MWVLVGWYNYSSEFLHETTVFEGPVGGRATLKPSQTPVEVRFPTCTLKLQWAAARPWECFLDFSFRPV